MAEKAASEKVSEVIEKFKGCHSSPSDKDDESQFKTQVEGRGR